MKPSKGRGHLARNIILAALLAVLCIGGVELAACRYFAPDTYERIVAPVRYAAGVAADAGMAALDAAGQFCVEVADAAMDTTAAALDWSGRQIAALGRQAAAVWEDLTSGPPEIVLELDEPPASQAPATDPPVTQVMEADGKQLLTGGLRDVVYYCQSDEEWAGQLYGTDPFGPYGCGPTAMAMAVASMTGIDTDPAKMAAWAAEHGYWARRSGSYHSIVMGTARSFGLEAQPIVQRTPEELRHILSSGGMVVALMGRGHFTDGGHFILLRGTTLTGEILVADPNSLERSLESWDPQLILDELSSARDNGAPLWAIYQPNT